MFEDLNLQLRTQRLVPENYLCSRSYKAEDTVVRVGDLAVGCGSITVMAGPCAVENQRQMAESARVVKQAGARVLRGGAFKPRTSPYAFQGLQEDGLKLLKEAGEMVGLPVITEVVDQLTLPLVADYADILQIGARNMQNFSLLKQAADRQKPILLKRGSSATIAEWLLAAEYILQRGNFQVILCERGICSFDGATRNLLDLTGVAMVKQMTHLPVIVDPSHAIGRREYIRPMSGAAIASGADGLLIEVHYDPDQALCDGQQSLTPQGFADTMEYVRTIAGALNKTV